MIGEIEAFIDQGIDVDRPVLAGTLARMQQHVLDDRVGALAVLHHLFEIAPSALLSIRRFLARILSSSGAGFSASFSSSISSADSAEKLLTKLSGFLIS